MNQNTINLLNEALAKAAGELKNGCEAAPETMNAMLEHAKNFSETKVYDGYGDLRKLSRNAATTERYQALDQQGKDIKKGREQAVAAGDFEKAARLRDEGRKVADELRAEWHNITGLTEGFNLHNNTLTIIRPGDSHRAAVLDNFLTLRG